MNRTASIKASLNAIFFVFESGNRNKAVVIAMALWSSNEIRQLRYAAAGSEDLPHQMPEAVFPDSSMPWTWMNRLIIFVGCRPPAGSGQSGSWPVLGCPSHRPFAGWLARHETTTPIDATARMAQPRARVALVIGG